MSLITSAQHQQLLANGKAAAAAAQQDRSIDHIPVVDKSGTAAFEPPKAAPKGEGPRRPE